MDPSGFSKGIDVNHWDDDARIDWQRVMSDGAVRFAYIKAWEAAIDPEFAAAWWHAGAEGITRGAYGFFRADLLPIAQADGLLGAIRNAGGVQKTDLPICVDLEQGGVKNFDGGRAEFCRLAHAYLDHIRQAVPDKTPIVYCSPGFAEQWLDDTFGAYYLWVAHYGVDHPTVPAGWSDWLIWQYGAGESGQHPVPGCPDGSVDVNWYHGSHDDMLTRLGLVAA